MQILMHIDICHDPPAVRIVFQVVDHTIHLIHHALPVLMFYLHLIPICFSDRAVFIRPTVPDMTVQIVDIIGFFLPDPKQLVGTAFDSGPSQSQRRKFL